METRPWSNTQLKKLGTSIRSGTPLPANVPTFDEVIVWYNDLASSVQKKIGEQDWSPLLEDRVPEITSRAKTIDTLRQKLQRNKGSSLSNVQDLAGVRFEAEMTLEEQDGVANAIAQMFGHKAQFPCLRDIRAEPHSGYRGVHVWLHLEGPVEVQIRTRLQGEWANMYEAAGDLFGREIRYDEANDRSPAAAVVKGLQSLSTDKIASLENDGQTIQHLTYEIYELTNNPTLGSTRLSRSQRKDLSDKQSRLSRMKESYTEQENDVRGRVLTLKSVLTDAKNGA